LKNKTRFNDWILQSKIPGKSTTECYEYLKTLLFLRYLIRANINKAEAIGKYAPSIRVEKIPQTDFSLWSRKK